MRKLLAIIGVMAGVVGAAAALYPLVVPKAPFIHIEVEPAKLVVESNGEIVLPSSSLDRFPSLLFKPMSEPIVLTGRFKTGRADLGAGLFDIASAGEVMTADLEIEKNATVEIGKGKFVLFTIKQSGLRVSDQALHCFNSCPSTAGYITVDVEIESAEGIYWMPIKIPLCLERAFPYERYGNC